MLELEIQRVSRKYKNQTLTWYQWTRVHSTGPGVRLTTESSVTTQERSTEGSMASVPGWSGQGSRGRCGSGQVTAPTCERQTHQTRRLFYVNSQKRKNIYQWRILKEQGKGLWLFKGKWASHPGISESRKDESGSYLKILQHGVVLKQ